MKKQYYLKDKKINVIGKIYQKDEHGIDKPIYAYRLRGIWAYTRQLSQDQIFSAKAYGNNETRLFVINYHDCVRQYDTIEYDGKFFSVTRIDTDDDYKTDMYIYVKVEPVTPTNIRTLSQ